MNDFLCQWHFSNSPLLFSSHRTKHLQREDAPVVHIMMMMCVFFKLSPLGVLLLI